MIGRFLGAVLAVAVVAMAGCYAAHERARPVDGAVRCEPASGEVGPVVSASLAACGGPPRGVVTCWTVDVGPDGRATRVTGDGTGLPPALVGCVRGIVVAACFPDDAGNSYTICPLST